MVISHAACSKALNPFEILMSAVVTIVVSRAGMKRQNHNPAMMVCSLAGLIPGTPEGTETGLLVGFADIMCLNRCSQNFKVQSQIVKHSSCHSRNHEMGPHICPVLRAPIASISGQIEALGLIVGRLPAAREDGTTSGPYSPDHIRYVRTLCSLP